MVGAHSGRIRAVDATPGSTLATLSHTVILAGRAEKEAADQEAERVMHNRALQAAWEDGQMQDEGILLDDEPDDRCTHSGGHEWTFTGTAYGGDDDRWHGEGRCFCMHCGADGDA